MKKVTGFIGIFIITVLTFLTNNSQTDQNLATELGLSAANAQGVDGCQFTNYMVSRCPYQGGWIYRCQPYYYSDHQDCQITTNP